MKIVIFFFHTLVPKNGRLLAFLQRTMNSMVCSGGSLK